jgi:hypothetical protein
MGEVVRFVAKRDLEREPCAVFGVVVAAMEFCEERDNPPRGYAV